MKKLTSVLLILGLLFSSATPAFAQFIPAKDWVTAGCAYVDPKKPGEGAVATLGGIVCIIKNILYQLPYVIALAALAMVIMAGIRLVSAGADPKAYASAMQTFQWAVIGLILLSGAWLILILIERFTGAPVTQFGLP